MQNAPSVVYPVGRSAFEGRLLIAVAAGLGATMAFALVTADAPAAAWMAAALLLAAWAAWAWHDSRRACHGWLQWHAGHRPRPDAQAGQWCWQTARDDGGTPLERVEPVLDLRSRWLLRLRSPGFDGPRWVWVEAQRAPADWPALRRALVQARPRD